MSFEIARMIVQSYRQSNEQRIKSSMELAYREALETYKSEAAAREAAIKVLETDQKLLDTMLKNIEKSRQEIIKGNAKIAKENLAREQRNAVKKSKYEYQLEKEKRDAEQAKLDRRYKQQEADLRAAQAGAVVDASLDAKMTSARDWANDRVLSDDLFKENLTTPLSDLAEVLSKENVTRNEIANAILKERSGLKQGLNNYISEARKTQNGLGDDSTSDVLIKYRKADTAHQIMDYLKINASNANEDDLSLVEEYLYGDLPDGYLGLNASQGRLAEGKEYTPTDVENKYEEQVQRKYKSLTGNVAPAGSIQRPIAPGRLGKPVREPIYEELLETKDATVGRELRQAAQPVFEALRNDFEITAEEQEKISPEAINAYNKLKEVVIDNPLAVTREEQTLLDDLALQRQYEILQQKRRISTMNPQLASTERVRARAADIAEPEQKFDASKFSPAQQKYFATERKAYELSDKTDNDIRNIGVPEKFGLSLFNETFDKGRKSYVDGQSYDTVLSRLETQFEGKPEEQLRALAAYNSRAMALQRASNPLIVDGQKNPDYLEALKALGK